ncbi:MAG: C10 family peptidase [Prevotella sp.]|nr:C10 family peptidase [Prevotella sp.]
MRRPVLLLICLLFSQLIWAGNITREEAQQKAVKFLNRHTAPAAPGSRMRMPVSVNNLSLAKDADTYYVFNVGQKEGFVLVSADDRAPAILGYADDGCFDSENMPENMRAWLQGYADQLQWLKQHPQQSSAAPVLDEHAAVAPLLTSTWNQPYPYNILCPIDDGKSTYTGCVATAMAQVLYYYKYPAKTTAAMPGYTTNSKGITVGRADVATINWRYMKDHYTGEEPTAQKNAVAKLMQLCGTSVHMDYTNAGSGAYSSEVSEALKNYFDFDAATSYVSRNDYRARAWDNLVYNELANSRPVYYSGSAVGGGHAFVIDGYDKEGLYHVNWGWGGSCNGYFLLSVLDPGDNSGSGASSSTDGYSYSQEAVIGAQPNTGIVPPVEVKMTTYNMWPDETSTFPLTNDVYPITFYTEMYNLAGATYNFNIGAGVYDTSDQLVYAEDLGTVQLDNNWGWSAHLLDAEVPALPEGIYSICVLTREAGSDTWFKNDGSDRKYLTAIVADSTMTLEEPTIDLSGTMQVSEYPHLGKAVTVTTTIQNNGSFFNDELFLRVNGKNVGGRYFEVEAGKSEVLEMSFIPTEAVTAKIALGREYWVYDNGWNRVFDEITSTETVIEPLPTTRLSFSNGKVLNADADKVIHETHPIVQIDITNDTTYVYDDVIRTSIWKIEDDGGFSFAADVDTNVNIDAGETKTVDLDLGSLWNGTYWFLIIYRSEGQFTSFNDESVSYRKLYGYTVSVEGNDPETTPGGGSEPTFVGDGTLENPYTAEDALAVTSAMEADNTTAEPYYVQGIISRIKYEFSEKYGTAVFYISDDGTTDKEFTVYNAFFLENKSWTEGNTQIKVGDEVVLCGRLVNYRGTTPEMADKGGYIYSLNGMTDDSQPADGTYYLRNVASGKFWGAANQYGTQASLVDEYQYATLVRQADGTYTLQSMVSSGGNKIYFNGKFMDNESPAALSITKVDNGQYTIANGNYYYGNFATTTALGKSRTGDDERAFWQLLSEADVKKEQQAILAAATAEQPADATFLIRDAQFGRNRTDREEVWHIYECSNYTFGGPEADAVNYCAEAYHSPFTLLQEIQKAPKGVYQLQAQGFYRQDGTDNDDLPYFFLTTADGSDRATFPQLAGQENSMTDAALAFHKGNYLADPMFLELTADATVYVGANLEKNNNLWCIWDNFKLLYYGSNVSLDELKLLLQIDTVELNGHQSATGIYNLNGQQVQSLTKGLYIKNGKKFIVR